MITAIDPGPTHSALATLFDDEVVTTKMANADLVAELRSGPAYLANGVYGLAKSKDVLAIEMIASFGMAVGAEVFETCVWIGRFMEASGRADAVIRVPRMDVKMHLCHNSRAKDSNIRQAIIDRYGGKDVAIGRKAKPGPLYGVAGDGWSALAVALVVHDRLSGGVRAA